MRPIGEIDRGCVDAAMAGGWISQFSSKSRAISAKTRTGSYGVLRGCRYSGDACISAIHLALAGDQGAGGRACIKVMSAVPARGLPDAGADDGADAEQSPEPVRPGQLAAR